MLITPNARSLGHQRFGATWRGLEPPRHLQIFTLSSLKRIVGEFGFKITRAHTSARDAGYLLLFSERLKAGGSGADVIKVSPGELPPGRLMRTERWERFIARLGIPAGEELVIVARKPKRRG